ncbi:MAG TPA: hypothetical protein VF527_18200 [Pyrinomonadaceae bacterium]|jgi:hypothetical protein
MRITSNRKNTLEKAICQKAVAQFQTAIREWDQSPISEERRNKRKENIDRIAGRGRVFITALEDEIEYYLLPLITKLIQIELDLRVANHIPFTEERITDLKAYLRNLVKENWRYIVLQAYEETISNVLKRNSNNLLYDYQENELNKRRDEYLEIEPERLFDIIDTKLQDAFAESVIHAEKQKSDSPVKEVNNESIPSWFSIAGAVFGAITLLFLMLLIVLSLFDLVIPTTSRFILVAFLALSVGLSSTFLGGTAAAKGAISLPFFKEAPMSFALTGGMAVFVIVMVLGYALYIR